MNNVRAIYGQVNPTPAQDRHMDIMMDNWERMEKLNAKIKRIKKAKLKKVGG